MAKLFVYDAFNNRFFTYNLNENDPMPYSYGSTLKLREFRGASGANVLWTTTAAMEAWNLTRRTYGKSIPVGYAFKRIWEGGHGTISQHYAAWHLMWAKAAGPMRAGPSTTRRGHQSVGVRGAASY